jgi:uncharacterized protein YcaQ
VTERAGPQGVVEVAHNTCGIHAQVQAAAELSLNARVEGIVQQDVRDALWRDRTLVKAWTVRGTLHLHPAAELPLWYAARNAMGTGDEEGLPPWRDPEGALHPALSREEVDAVAAAVREALDGRCLLREELVEEVAGRTGAAARERLSSGFAFFLSEVCQGPPQGNKVTFARPDQWVEGWQEVDPEEALREVCRRYLYTYGPARATEFREWFGSGSATFKTADARTLFESLGDLEEVEVEGHHAYVVAGDTQFSKQVASVRLLPEYDAYIMGFRERDHLVPDETRAQVAAHGRGKYEGPAGVRFLLIDGVAVGLWERKKKARQVELRVTPVRTLHKGERAALASEAERIGAFLGLEPVLTVE